MHLSQSKGEKWRIAIIGSIRHSLLGWYQHVVVCTQGSVMGGAWDTYCTVQAEKHQRSAGKDGREGSFDF